MQNASKVANGYKTILSHLMTKDLEAQFNEFGLTMRDQNGEMKDAFTILKELAGAYNSIGTTIDETTGETVSLNDNMNKLLKDIGGAYNINVLTSGFDNFEQAINATESAMNSAGSASNEYAIALDTIKMKGEAVLGQLQQLIIGEGGLQSFIKVLLDGTTTVLKFINDIGGLQTILIAISGILITKFAPSIALSFGKLISMGKSLPTLIRNIALFTAKTGSLSNGLKAVGISASTAQIALGALTAIVTIGSIAWGKYKQSQEEAEQARQQTIQNAQQEIDSLDSLEKQISNESLSREELVDLIQNSSISAYTKEISALQNVNDMRQATIDKINEEKLARAQEIVDTGFGDYESALESESGLDKESISMGYEDVELQKQISDLKQLQESLRETRSEYEKGSSEYNSYTAKIDAVSDELSKLNKRHKDNIDTIDEYNDALATLGKKYNKSTGEIEDMTDAEKEAYKQSKKTADSLDDAGDSADSVSSKMYDLGSYSSDAMSSMNDATSDSQQIISDLASEIDNITSAYQTAVDAQYEYNQQGYLSVDTYSQLMQLAPQYLAMMIDENGQLYANADATTIAYQAKVYEMGITAARAQIQLADSLAGEAGAYAALGSAAANSTPSVYSLLEAELKLKQATMDADDYNALVKNINAISLMTEKTMANAGAYTSSIKPTNASTAATNKNTGARKANTDATKAQTEALKAQKEALEAEADALEKELDDYEIVIDYVKDLLKEEQEAVEEEKDAQLEAIQDKIDALEEEQEVFEENIDAQIDALEKQKDETEEYWDAQIDAIQNANDALEENMELQRLQEALASAKTQKVKVLKGGRFVYAEDEEAISKAEQELADYEMQLAVQRQIEELERLKEEALDSLEKQIEELENYRDEQKKNYEQQLKDLQDHYDAVEEEYDIRIKQYDEWLKQFEDMLEASSKRHAEILYNELVNEQGNWDARIAAFAKFVSNYEAKKNELDGIKNQINAITDQIAALESRARNLQNSVNGIVGQVGNQLANINSMASQAEAAAKRAQDNYNALLRYQYRAWLNFGAGKVYLKYQSTPEAAQAELNAYIRANPNVIHVGTTTGVDKIAQWATGTFSVPDDQIALVADPMRPSNRELVVGSKINQGDGILTSLKKGTGVIPAGQNLTENLINLANWSSNGGFERAFTTMNNSTSKVVHIENINLPNVENGEQLVEYLETNFVNDSIQYSNIRE